jgi:hypothetical protein
MTNFGQYVRQLVGLVKKSRYLDVFISVEGIPRWKPTSLNIRNFQVHVLLDPTKSEERSANNHNELTHLHGIVLIKDTKCSLKHIKILFGKTMLAQPCTIRGIGIRTDFIHMS